MANEVLSRLTRTMQGFFRIGDIRIKDDSGVVQMRNAGDTAFVDAAVQKIRIQDGNAVNAVVLTSPGGLGAGVTFTLPGNTGSSGQFLRTDGTGVLSWADAQSNASIVEIESFTEATSSPLTIIASPPANSTLVGVRLEVTSAAAGGSPTIEIGTSGDTDAYMTATENDILEPCLYMVHPMEELGTTPDPIIATITPDGQTFSGEVYLIYSTPS